MKSLTHRKNSRALAAEFVGTALLLAGVVGSGIMGQRLSQGNDALALLANALATGFLLPVLILLLAPFSGAHFNPVVSLAEALSRRLRARILLAYVAAQTAGAVAGVWLAHAMFAEPILQASTHMRTGGAQWISEFVATFGLLLLVLLRRRFSNSALPWMIGAYIAAAYWFTASTSFANPAVTLARSLTNTFAGIRPGDAPGFMLAQLAGMLAALAFTRWIDAEEQTDAGKTT
ncbi:MAG TPA: MIP/aquaporin family protein [Fibrobacteria bacterium]|nr:MIP/aquaporin family protein [Fibrobacteria bacterium]